MTKKASSKKKISKTKNSKKDQILEIDITKHELVPTHIKLSPEEKKEVLKKYGIALKDIPKIKIKDPAIRHLDVKPGDLIKIIRNSPTAGEYIYYRVVVEE